MAVLIENTSVEPFTLPWPLLGVLGGKQRIVLNTSLATILAAFGGEDRLVGIRVSEISAQSFYDYGLVPDSAARLQQGEQLRQAKVEAFSLAPSVTPYTLTVADGTTTVFISPTADGDVIRASVLRLRYSNRGSTGVCCCATPM
jgi:hypothetical protein